MAEPIAAQREEDSRDRRDILSGVAAVLPLASILVIAAGVAYSVSLFGGRISDRLAYGASRFVGPFNAGLVLAAATIIAVGVQPRDRRARWTHAASAFVAIVLICAAVYRMWFLVTLDSPKGVPGESDFAAFLARSQYQAWSARVGEMLGDAVTVLLAVATLVVLRRRFKVAESPSTAAP